MKHGNTLSDDKFDGYQFDYIISNPPFGIEWKNEKQPLKPRTKRVMQDDLEQDFLQSVTVNSCSS